MKFGTAVHQAILEPNAFKALAVVEPEFAGTGSRAAKEKWHLENHGQTILKREQYDTILGMLKSISKHEHASKIIADGAAEESFFWKDSATGLECKVRPDFVREGHILVDVKTTEDASFQAFQKSIANFMYHVQAAYYLEGVSKVVNQKFDTFIILAIEKSAPYAVNTFILDEATIEAGKFLYCQALQKLKKCIDTNEYPAYPDELVEINLPSWAFP